jgi:predicted HAD superfamily Cof-like phosphohydrolase
MTMIEVREFNRAFEVPMLDEPGLPGLTDQVKQSLAISARALKIASEQMLATCKNNENSICAMRAHLMIEELSEVLQAMSEGDLAQVLHESCDMRVVNDGTLLCLGLGGVFHKAFNRVHEANMSKLVDGKPLKSDAGRVIKGPNFKKAYVGDLVVTQGEEVL